jgi:hypothetical protein
MYPNPSPYLQPRTGTKLLAVKDHGLGWVGNLGYS